MGLHQHLKAWRKARKLTLEQLAAIIGSKPNTIHGWESGKRAMDLKDLERIADAYGVHPAAFLFAPAGSKEFENLREAASIIRRLPDTRARTWLEAGKAMTPPEIEGQ